MQGGSTCVILLVNSFKSSRGCDGRAQEGCVTGWQPELRAIGQPHLDGRRIPDRDRHKVSLVRCPHYPRHPALATPGWATRSPKFPAPVIERRDRDPFPL